MKKFVFGHLEPADVEHAAGFFGAETATALSTAFRTARAGFALLSAIEDVVARHDLTPARFRILMVLAFHPAGASNPTTLAEILDVTPASVTGLLRPLESRGLIERVPSDEDRRRVEIRITDHGTSVVGEAIPEVAALGDVITTATTTPSEFLSSCDRITQAFNDH